MAPQFGATRQKIVETRIGRSSCSEPLAAAYEAHTVFITNLPEVLLLHMDKSTAKQLYQEWQQCEVIIGKRPRRGHLPYQPLAVMPAVGGRSSSSTMFDQPLAAIASSWR